MMTTTYCYPEGAVWLKPTEPTLSEPTPTPEEQAAHDVWAADNDAAEAFGWLTLNSLTAGQIAMCPITVRPCRSRCREGAYYVGARPGGLPWSPVLVDGQWINIWCGHRGSCACSTVSTVVLPVPVGRIIEVKIDGVVLDPDLYRVDDGKNLVRLDGEEWPYCQDMSLNDGVGTFLVTYMQGFEATNVEKRAVGSLASEFIKMLGGDKKCRLPRGTRTVTRQGVNIELVTDLFAAGTTGLPEVDAIIRALNPNGLKFRPRVWSPDQQRPVTPTGGRF
jgi:hypothetical protein